jgi:blue copper oxidase
MRMKYKFIAFLAAAATFLAAAGISWGQNPLFIPDTLSGDTMDLVVQNGSRTFFPGFTTPTFGYNGPFLGPTLLMNKGDSITLTVTNYLTVPTTVHWHGFHLAAMNDGGPHQVIGPSQVWSPSFKVRNEAATYWYHPHGEGKTEIQVSKGLAGMIIIRDSAEATHTLPRKYGVDDFPLILQSRAFDVLYQVATATHEDSVMMVNGTRDPFLAVPRQVVRFRILNGSADRSFYLGLSDNRNFHLIASDGGLLSAPYATNRVRLSTGERVEVLVDLGADTVGTVLDWVSYASELPHGIIGADSVGTAMHPIAEGYYDNPLNGADFTVLRLNIMAAMANPVTSIPGAFAPVVPLDTGGVHAQRSLHFSADTTGFGIEAEVHGPFLINGASFHMDSIGFVIPLNSKEIWTLTNETEIAHPFHIHDVQFFVLDINGNPPPPQYQGYKDVMLVMPEDTVRFITQFTTFADDSMAYMYHCHLLHHEDDGMMGQFLVVNPPVAVIEPAEDVAAGLVLWPNPVADVLGLRLHGGLRTERVEVWDVQGRRVGEWVVHDGRVDVSLLAPGVYQVRAAARGRVYAGRFVKGPN